MRPDRVKDRLTTKNDKLTNVQRTSKMVDLINLYHSVDLRYGSREDKQKAKELIEEQVKRLRPMVGTALKANCLFYLQDKEAWEASKGAFNL